MEGSPPNTTPTSGRSGARSPALHRPGRSALLQQLAYWGRANQLGEESIDPFSVGIEPSLFSRKGYLCLVCRSDAKPELPLAVMRHYYESASFDIVPSLCAALIRAFGEWPDAREQLPLAVVTQGLELQAVGSENAVIWLMRSGQVREIFRPLSGPKPWSMRLDAIESVGLYAMQWRLATGDALVLTTQDALTYLTRKRARRILAKGGSAVRTAAAIARAARRPASAIFRVGAGQPPPPVTVMRTRGYSAVPELTGSGGAPSTRPIEPAPDAPRGRSPIWPALGIAVLSIALAFWMLVLTRAPSATPAVLSVSGDAAESSAMAGAASPSPGARPTATAHPPAGRAQASGSALDASEATPEGTPAVLATPKLLRPGADATVRGSELTLLWEWPGDLAADEFFDVRMWLMGADSRSIAWTQEPTYIERTPSEGWHSWTVRIVRGDDGVIQEVLAEGPTSNFHWNPAPVEDKPTVEPPTRLAPDDRPTRVSPPSGGD